MTGYWPGNRFVPAPLPIASPWQSPYLYPGNAGLNQWQVYGGMDHAGGVWVAFVYRGHVSHLLSGNLFGNAWSGSGAGSNSPLYPGWGGDYRRPPVDGIFEDPVWDGDSPT